MQDNSQTIKKIDKVLSVLTYLNFALLFAILIVEGTIGERRWWGVILTFIPQHPLLIPTVFLLLLTIFSKRWKILLLNIPAVAISIILLGVNIPLHRANGEGVRLRAMTWNVERVKGGLDGITDTIKHEQADIVFLQEAREMKPLKQSSELQQEFPGWTMTKAGEVAILSRYPILREKVYRTIGHRLMLEVTIDANGIPVTAIAVHYSTSINDESLRRHSVPLREYMTQTAAVRFLQTDALLDVASKAKSPIIIAGDFNTPPLGVSYDRIAHEYPDAFNSAGFGTGYTYPTKFPVIRIDHIFTSKTVGVRKCYVGRTKTSDHLPMVAELFLPE